MLDDPLVKQLLTNLVEDESNLPIVTALDNGIETDEGIAEETGIKLNIVRKILYRLYDLGIASYKRSKDPETQWFTYSWKFEKDEIINHIIKDSENYLNMLNEELMLHGCSIDDIFKIADTKITNIDVLDS
jgi:transcription initiation factor TFIIE subunit alpha